MDWTKIAIDKLCKYPDKKEALKNLKLQIYALEAKSTSAKGFVTDKIPTAGGGNVYSDKQLDIIVEMEELKERRNVIRKELAPIENALDKLDEEERWLVDTYSRKLKGVALENAMWEKLHYQKTVAYSKRTAAIKRFTMLLYGIIEG